MVDIVGNFFSPVLKLHLIELVSNFFEILNDLTKFNELLSEMIDWVSSLLFTTDVNDACGDVVDRSEIKMGLVLLFRVLASDEDSLKKPARVIAFITSSSDTMTCEEKSVTEYSERERVARTRDSSRPIYSDGDSEFSCVSHYKFAYSLTLIIATS